MRRRLVRLLVKPLFLMVSGLILLTALTTLVRNVFSDGNVGLEDRSKYNQKQHEYNAPGPCEDCRNTTDKVVDRDSHSLKKQEDNLKKSSNNNTDQVSKRVSNSLKKQEDNLKKSRNNTTDKVVDRDSNSLKKQEDNLKKSSNNNTDQVTKRVSNSLKKQEDNLKKSSNNTDKVVEGDSNSSKKQEDNEKNNNSTDKEVKGESHSSKKQGNNLKTSSNVKPQGPSKHSQKKTGSDTSGPCKDCSDKIIDKIVERYSLGWKKQEDNFKKFRSLLSSKCSGITKAIITQTNTPVGSDIMYDAEKKRKPYKVTPQAFNTFPKEHPFLNKSLDTCAVVGNGGILANSSCGESIDSAQFIFRCNIPPLTNGYEQHVGSKTNLVTVNPSIILQKYKNLMEHRRPFVERLRIYGDSIVLLPAFAYAFNTPVCQRALYAIQDFESPAQPVYLNSEYLEKLAEFWRSQGLKEARLSTGLMMVSLALEVCTNVDLYGFWPFNKHPHGHQPLTNHYYDNVPGKGTVHSMPSEFEQLLNLHNQGVLRLHLGNCLPDTK